MGPERRSLGGPGAAQRFLAAPVLGFALVVIAATRLAPAFAAAGSIEKVLVNQPPQTILTSGPPDSTTSTLYRVRFFWWGTDPDGKVDHFDFIMVDHPRSKDGIGPGAMDPVVVTVPAPDDPRWTSTAARDSIFVTLADTLRRDPRPRPGETPADVLRQPFERWHTFFIRAVDDLGEPDPTPDYRSFNAVNVAPVIHLLPPVQPNVQLTVPPVVTLSWDGQDPVDETTAIAPVASRYVIIDSKYDLRHPGTPYVSYPDSLYALPSRFAWSAWRAWDLPDASGRRAVISGLSRVGDFPGSGYYLFAVQAMDEAGAITAVFDAQSNGWNNVALLRVVGSAGPLLTVREASLGTQTFVGGSNPVALDIAAGQTLSFTWSADESHYGGTITGTRYGWDIRNPDNDEEWSEWSASSRHAPPRSFASGAHRFFLQARDNAGSITRAIYELTVHRLTRSRDLLWVDDSDFAFTPEESSEDSRWLVVLGQVAAAGGLDFDPALDVYDVIENRTEPPPMQKVFDYKVIVWSNRGRSGSSGLRWAAQFFDPIPRRNQNTAKANLLNIYLASGGAMWISGFRPAKQLWPDERARGMEGEPVNVTNWDDPIELHPPGVDSVGTTSLLYKMGIEMFDVGSALAIRRSTPQHYCTALRPAAPGAPDLQVGPLWAQGGTGGRTNIEIYDMPPALAVQSPPLVPPPGKIRVLYTYVSQVPEDPSRGVLYPLTADNQPMFLMAKASLQDPHYNMAFCGFEPYVLEARSHEQLARHVLLQEMGLGPTPVFLQSLQATVSSGVVRIRWEVNGDRAEFLLRAQTGATEWDVPFAATGVDAYEAIDDSANLAQGMTVIYSLYAREAGSQWAILAQETVTLTTPPPRLQLLPPQPNPFNPSVRIGFVLPAAQHVRLGIYTVEGRRLTTLLDAIRPAGPTSVTWDGADAHGLPAASGLYLARLETAGVCLSRKLVLMK